jgi:hypothetical protein
MNSLTPYLIVDICLVVGLALALVSRLSFWHPATVYLLFHLYSISWRAVNLAYLGAAPMYANNPNADVISVTEYERALVCADIGLLVFCSAALLAHAKFQRASQQPIVRRTLSPKIITVVCVVAMPAGLWALYAAKSGVSLSDMVADSGYFQSMAMWPIGCVGMLVYAYGFRWYSVMIGILYIALVALQGYHRFMVLLPLIFFAAYYLQSRRRLWPTPLIIVGGLALALVFPRLKYIGQAYQNGDTGEALYQLALSFTDKKTFDDVSAGEEFFDQFAGALTMVDESGKKFYGSTYLAIVTLPIPRSMWADKPGLADHMNEISTSRRQYNLEGRILTYLGEAYLNFGYFGFLLVPGMLGFLLSNWCLRATSGPMRRLDRYLYTVFFMALIQTYRDGMLSLFVFTIVHNIPMAVAWALHLFPGAAPRVLDLPPADPRAPEDGMITVLP